MDPERVDPVIASVEATEAIKLVINPGARSRHLLVVDLWDLVFEKLEVPRDPDRVCCGSRRSGEHL